MIEAIYLEVSEKTEAARKKSARPEYLRISQISAGASAK